MFTSGVMYASGIGARDASGAPMLSEFPSFRNARGMHLFRNRANRWVLRDVLEPASELCTSYADPTTAEGESQVFEGGVPIGKQDWMWVAGGDGWARVVLTVTELAPGAPAEAGDGPARREVITHHAGAGGEALQDKFGTYDQDDDGHVTAFELASALSLLNFGSPQAPRPPTEDALVAMFKVIRPHHETFSTTIKPPYSPAKGSIILSHSPRS
jgi:hypothetical protein